MSGRKRNIYLSVMGIGALALALDRFVFSGAAPSLVQAERTESPAVTNLVGEVMPSDSRSALLPWVPFPQSVPRWDPSVPIRDIFLPPESVSMGSNLSRGNGGSRGAAADASRLGMAEFATKHKLQAIADYGDLRIAVTTAGKWVRENDVVDGCTVISVSGTTVRFSCFDGEDVLSLSP